MNAETAELYDAIYTRVKDYRDEAEKVRTWIAKLAPGARTILDVACGTGEHAKYLSADYQIDGIDLNRDFLFRCRGPFQRFGSARQFADFHGLLPASCISKIRMGFGCGSAEHRQCPLGCKSATLRRLGRMVLQFGLRLVNCLMSLDQDGANHA